MRVLRAYGLSDEMIKRLPMSVALEIADEVVKVRTPPQTVQSKPSSQSSQSSGGKKMVAARRKNK